MKLRKAVCVIGMAFLLISTIYYSGCSPTSKTPQGNSPNSNGAEQEQNTTGHRLEERGAAEITEVKIDLGEAEGEKGGAFGYYNNTVLAELVSEDTLRFVSYDVSGSKKIDLGNMPAYKLGSGSTVIAGDCLYVSYSFEDENRISLLQVDLRNHKTTVFDEFEGWPPFQYYEAIDEDTLLVFQPKQTADGEGYDYSICKYSVKDKTQTVIIKSGDAVDDIATFDYSDGVIYTYQHKTVDGEKKKYIRCYDANGHEIKEYVLDVSLSNQDAISKIEVLRNYVFLWTLNSEFLALQIGEEDELKQIEIEGLGHLRSFVEPLQSDTGLGCIFDRANQTLIRHDGNSDCFVRQNILLEANWKVTNACMDESGGVLLCAQNYTLARDDMYTRYFYVPPLS